MKERIAIVGIGEIPTGRFPERSAIQCAIESGRMAIQDSGLPKDEIDTLIPTAALCGPAFNTDLVTDMKFLMHRRGSE